MTTSTTPASPRPIPLPGRNSDPAHHLAHEHAHRDRQDWWVPIFRGGWLVIVGAFALYSPPTTLFALALLFATTVFISAGVLLTNGFALRAPLPVAQGVFSLGIAAVIAFMPPDLWAATVIAVSLWAIAMGAIDILMVRRHQRTRGSAFLFAAGAVSIAGGLVGLFALRIAEVPVAVFGVLALLAGAALMGYGMRRRRRSGHVAAVNAANRDESRRLDDAQTI